MKKKLNNLQIGFTLIEVMITVAIIGIISSIAYPSYIDSVRKGLRADATTALMELALAEEKFMIQHGIYTTNYRWKKGLAYGSQTTEEGYYTLSVAAGPTGSINTSFTITATAVAGTTQARDSDCIKFTINSRNQRSAKTSSDATNDDCW